LRLANAIALYREPGGDWQAEGGVTVWAIQACLVAGDRATLT